MRITALTALLLIAAACSDRDRPAPSPQVPAARPSGESGKASEEPPTPADIAWASAKDPAREPNDINWSGGDAAQGKVLYKTHCSICHGDAGRGDGPATAALNPKPRDFTAGRFYIDANANNVTGEQVDIARVIRDGPAPYGGSLGMQGWRDAFSDDQIRHLVAYIRNLAGGGNRD